MTSKETSHAPIFYSIIGLLVLLAWLMHAFYYAQSGLPNNTHPTIGKVILDHAYMYFLNWKLFSLLCLIWGTLVCQKQVVKVSPTSIFKLTLALVLLWVLSVYVSSVFLIALPLILFGFFIKSMHYFQERSFIIVVVFLIVALIFLSFFNGPELINTLPFHHLYLLSFTGHKPMAILQEFISASTLLGLIYGFLLIAIGFWIGKTRWLFEYPFHYNQLKKLFYYSLILLVLWVLLNYFNAYFLISIGKIGDVFFILDGLSINIIVIFLYLFLLIYLENYRWSKIFLKLLESSGRCWPFNSFILLCYIFLLPQFQVHISVWLNFVFSLTIFAISAIVSHFMNKLKLGLCSHK